MTFKGRMILIVEDDSDSSNVVAGLMTQWKARSVTVASGEDAVAWLGQSVPDFCIIDLKLRGDLDGIGLLRWMRQQTSLVNVQAILISAYMTDQAKVQALQFGPVECLTKPVDQMVIHRLMIQALG